jgi:electron transfer flavoprotein alpha subunit
MPTVGVYSERGELRNELLGLAGQLKGRDGAATCLSFGAEDATDLFGRGAGRVIRITDPSFSHYEVHGYTSALATLIQREKLDILLIGATRNGNELASRVAQRLGVGCSTDCTHLEWVGNALQVKRLYFSGRFEATQRIVTRPAIATVPPHRFEPLALDPGRQGAAENVDLTAGPVATRTIETRPKVRGMQDIERAEIIVSAGRGVKRAEDLKLIQELAEVIGAQLGGSRPLTEDLKWLPADAQVGLSGKKVKPKLYVACGISGQIQHIVGMRDAQTIVAINMDPSAPIFDEADYCIVGDLYKVVPALTAAFRQLLK